MRGISAFQAAAAAEVEGEEEKLLFWSTFNKRRKGGEELEEALLPEPRSVLEQRRSPSPPTSTSTLSSFLGGGGGAASSETGGVAAVSDKWPLSSSGATTPSTSAGTASEEAARKEKWAAELPPIPASLAAGGGGGVEDWEAMLSEPPVSPVQDQNFLRWIMGDIEDASSAASGGSGGGLALHHISQSPVELDSVAGRGGNGVGLPFGDPASNTAVTYPPSLLSSVSSGGGFSHKAPNFGRGNSNVALPPAENFALPLFLPPVTFLEDSMDEKSLLSSTGLLVSQHQQAQPQPHASFFFPLPHFAAALQENLPLRPPLKLQALEPFPDSPGTADLFLRRNQPQQQPLNVDSFPLQPRSQGKRKLAAGDEAAQQQQQQQQALIDQLLKAAELVEAGNSVTALGILARLNHQLPSPVGKPLLRSAFYFKEALQLLTTNAHPPPPPSATLASPLDVVLKLGAYKTFSDVSPIFQFINFTCVQALLEELGNANRIHIIDFDLGVGGQWSSFMQELAQRRCSATTAAPALKITAFATHCSHHPLELHLTRENLCHFAEDLNIPLEFNFLSLDHFDHALLLGMLAGANEAIVVKLPLGSASHPQVPILLRFVKQLSPKIVVSVEQGCDRSDLPFAHHFFHALQSCTVLLDSIDAAGTNQDVSSKIERFLVQPWVENSVLGRYRAAERMLPWRTLFTSAGFIPVQFSNFTETQAECLLKRVQVRGFHVEKRQASLSLCWQRGELVSVSAWRC